MASIENVPIGRLKVCTLKGFDARYLVRKISLRESICTSYLSGDINLLDCNNFIDPLKLRGLDPIQLSFDAPPNGKSYDVTVYILSIQAEVSPENLKCIAYTIAYVSSEFFTDRANLVQESTTPGTTGVALSHKIWGECGFTPSLRAPVQDTPLQDGNQPFHIDYTHPFTAISQIRDAMNFPAYPEGNVLLYRDNVQQNLVPLKYLFDTMSSQQTFKQSTTWGKSWKDQFDADNLIIDAKQQTRGSGTVGTGGGAAGGHDLAATAMQGQRKYDAILGKLTNNEIFGGGGSGLGGSPNLMGVNSDNRAAAMDFSAKVRTERNYAALVKAAPQYNIRVPLRTGINCTVGKGATFNLLPAGGDQFAVSGSAAALMLISDLIHEVFFDLRLVKGTTTFQVLSRI